MTNIDPARAKRAVDLRYGEEVAHKLARNSIRDEDWVRSHLALAKFGITHDEELVRLYNEDAKT